MTFNPREEIAKIVKAEASIGGPKLSFAEQCAAFAALYEGAPNRVVRRAFGIGAQSTSKLAGCLEFDPEPYRPTFDANDLVSGRAAHDHNGRRNPARYRHYETVAREFEALGAEEFIRRYMTPEIIDRLTAARKRIAEMKGGAHAFSQRDEREKNDRK